MVTDRAIDKVMFSALIDKGSRDDKMDSIRLIGPLDPLKIVGRVSIFNLPKIFNLLNLHHLIYENYTWSSFIKFLSQLATVD